MAFVRQLEWLTARFYLYFEVSPTSDATVKIYNIDKFGNQIVSSFRQYNGESLNNAIRNAYNAEQK
jgi:hypothetical protein